MYIRVILIMLFLCPSKMKAQDVQLGFVLGANLFQKTTLDTAIFSPSGSYHTYLEAEIGKGLIDKNVVFNSMNGGVVFNFSFKKFTFNLEPQYYYQRTIFKFSKPIVTERMIGKRAFRLPIYGTYKFFKNENSIYGLAGMVYNYEKNWDIQAPGIGFYIGSDSLYQNVINLGDNHFKGILYDDHSYWNYMVGFGKKFNNWNMSIRYLSQIDITKHEIPAKVWQLEFSINVLLLSSKDFTKKHFLYVD